MPSSCTTCYSLTGLHNSHDVAACPLSASMVCRRCHTRGHLSASCGAAVLWERPSCLEELIPDDVRSLWGIRTMTPISYGDKGLAGTAGTDSELCMEIEVSQNDKKMRAFMVEHDIDTTHKTNENLQRIREWAMHKGLRLHLTA
jgi:hypothetical protein